MHLIVGLGGGLLANGNLPDHAEARVRHCVNIANKPEHDVILFSSCFTLNKPPVLNKDSFVLSEASIMASRALELGFAGKVLCEQQSHDTIGSAFFVFLLHVKRLDPRRITVVTSSFHMPRAKVIFRHVAKLWGMGPESLRFASSDRTGDPIREGLERKALKSYSEDWLPIDSIRAYSDKLLEEHMNYNMLFQSRKRLGAELDTY